MSAITIGGTVRYLDVRPAVEEEASREHGDAWRRRLADEPSWYSEASIRATK